MWDRTAEQRDGPGAAAVPSCSSAPTPTGKTGCSPILGGELAGARDVRSPTALSLRQLPGGALHQSRRGGLKWLG
jgi:hypothetical protein